jgi:hypothetical protein
MSVALSAFAGCGSADRPPELRVGPEVVLNDDTFEVDPATCWSGQRHLVVYGRQTVRNSFKPDLFGQALDQDGTPARAPFPIFAGATRPFYQTVTCGDVNTLVVLRDISTTSTLAPNRIRGFLLDPDSVPGPIFPITSSDMNEAGSVRPVAVAADGAQFALVISEDEDRAQFTSRLVTARLAADPMAIPSRVDQVILPHGLKYHLQLVRTSTGYLAVWPDFDSLRALRLNPDLTFVERDPVTLAKAVGQIETLASATGGAQIAIMWSRTVPASPVTRDRYSVIEGIVLGPSVRNARPSRVASSEDVIGNLDVEFDGRDFVVLWREFEIDPTLGMVKEGSLPRSQLARVAPDGSNVDPTPLEGPQVLAFGRLDLVSSHDGRSVLLYASGDGSGEIATSQLRSRAVRALPKP